MIFDLRKEENSIIKVIGVGGGGSNAVTHMYKQGIVGVDFAISNTDSQAMALSPVPYKIHLGPMLTDEQGVIQLLSPERILQDSVRTLLFANPMEAGHETY